MLTGITGADSLDITANEPVKLSCTFRSDYWDDSLGATGTGTGPIYYDGTYPAQTDSENLKGDFSVKANTNSVK